MKLSIRVFGNEIRVVILVGDLVRFGGNCEGKRQATHILHSDWATHHLARDKVNLLVGWFDLNDNIASLKRRGRRYLAKRESHGEKQNG